MGIDFAGGIELLCSIAPMQLPKDLFGGDRFAEFHGKKAGMIS